MTKLLKILCKFYTSVICIYTKYINLQNRKNFTISQMVENTVIFSDIGLTKF